MDTILTLIPPQYLVYVLAVGGVASIAASVMKPPTGPGWYATAYRAVNFAAVNLNHARNASAPAPVVAQPGVIPNA